MNKPPPIQTNDDEEDGPRLARDDEMDQYKAFRDAASTHLATENVPPTAGLSFVANYLGELAGAWTLAPDQCESFLALARMRYLQVLNEVLASRPKN